ncbi:MAG: hypothetical protein N4A44_03875 [Alphaproteobacteria bacterium]|jgi:hypothetical protein|nr:hypothetical protein [Alphaproteobacteria bacterium]
MKSLLVFFVLLQILFLPSCEEKWNPGDYIKEDFVKESFLIKFESGASIIIEKGTEFQGLIETSEDLPLYVSFMPINWTEDRVEVLADDIFIKLTSGREVEIKKGRIARYCFPGPSLEEGENFGFELVEN